MAPEGRRLRAAGGGGRDVGGGGAEKVALTDAQVANGDDDVQMRSRDDKRTAAIDASSWSVLMIVGK